MSRTSISLLGCGAVGSAVVRALRGEPHLARRYDIAAIAVRNPDVPRDCPLRPGELTTRTVELAAATEWGVVFEAIGGLGVARDAVTAALASGRPVVTANKTLIAEHGPELRALARARGTALRYEGAVAAAVPMVDTLHRLARTQIITRLEGVLNGTTNYILSRVGSGDVDLGEALGEAQARGYAERDATRDLDGRDAADKLAILAQIAWGTPVRNADVARRGIDAATIRAARRTGEGVLRLVATATPRGVPTVEPRLLPPGHPLARLDGVDNGLLIHTRRGGVITLSGPGAGGDATAAAMLTDLAALDAAGRLGWGPVDPIARPSGIAVVP